MKKVLNKYLLSEREMYFESNEIGLVIIDNKGRLLISTNNGYIDIPKIILKHEIHSENKDKIIKDFLNNILEEKDLKYDELYKLDSYRYRDINEKGLHFNSKAHIDYYLVNTNLNVIDGKYKFLTPSNINYILEALNYKKYSEGIKDELELLISEVGEDYLSKDRLLEFNVENYKEHLTCLLSKKHTKDFLEKQYPFIDYSQIIESTLEFIKNISTYSNSIDGKKWTFTIERVNLVNSFSKKLWYSDILIAPYKGKNDSLVSLYLLKSFFKDDIILYLDDNRTEIKEGKKIIGVVMRLPELIIKESNDTSLLETSKVLIYK